MNDEEADKNADAITGATNPPSEPPSTTRVSREEPLQKRSKHGVGRTEESAPVTYMTATVEGELHVGPYELVEDVEPIDVYLIHRGPDTKRAVIEPLAYILKHYGVTRFADTSPETYSMPIGNTNTKSMARALSACRFAVALFSNSFRNSRHCVKEINTILHRQAVSGQEDLLLPFYYSEHLFEHAAFSMVRSKSASAHIRQGQSDTRFALEMALRILIKLGKDPIPDFPELTQVYDLYQESLRDTDLPREIMHPEIEKLRLLVDEDDIDKHVEKFVPGTRDWAFKLFDEWVATIHSSRVLVLVADAGMGKTAMMSWLIRKRPDIIVAYHFCQWDDSDTSNPRLMLLSFVRQLCEKIPGYKTEVAKQLKKHMIDISRAEMMGTDITAIFKILKIPLKSVSPPKSGKCLVILIDALDEVSSEGSGKDELLRCIVKYFGNLPKWLKVCITTRPEANMITIMGEGDTMSFYGPLSEFKPLVVEPNKLENETDLKIYFTELLEKLLHAAANNGINILEATDILTRKSGGYFIWADYAAKQLHSLVAEKSKLSKGDIDDLPDGMPNFYWDQMSRLLPESDQDGCRKAVLVRQALPLLVAAREPLPQDLFEDFLEFNPQEIWVAINTMSLLLPVRNCKVGFYHKSFADWLVDPKWKIRNANHVDEQLACNNMAQHCLGALEKYRREGTLQVFRSQLLENKEQAPKQFPSLHYLLKHSWKHFFSCSHGKQMELLPIASKLALNMDVLLGRALIDDLYGHSMDCSSLGDLFGNKTLILVGRALQLSMAVAAEEVRQIPTQMIGRLLGVANSSDASSPDKSQLKQLLSDWKKHCYGYSWWCPNDPCWEQANSPCLRILEGHSNLVMSVSWSPDSTKVASGSGDTSVRIWDAVTGECLRTLEGHSRWVISVSWSPDSTNVASGSDDKSVRIWDAVTGECLRTLEGHSNWVTSVSWSPDSTKIASGSGDKSVRIWDTVTGECLRTLEGHSDYVMSVSWSPDSTKVASGSDDSSVRIWDAVTGECLRTLEGHFDNVTSVSWSRDSTKVASGSGDKSVRIWDAVTGECLRTLEGHSQSVESVSWSPDRTKVASGSGDDSVRIWDAVTGECLRTLEGHSGSVMSVSWCRDSTKVASGSGDKSVRIWDAVTGECLRTLEGHSRWVRSVSWSPDSTKVASGSGDNSVRIWDAVTGECRRTLEGHSYYVTSVAWSPDSAKVASGSHDKSVRIWDAVTGECLRTLEGHSDTVRSVSWSSDSTNVASGSDDTSVRIWDAVTGECLRTLEGHSRWVMSVSWSPDSTKVASGSDDSSVRIWDAVTGECLRTLEGHSNWVISVSWSPDSTKVASGSGDESVRIWDAVTGECLRILKGQSSWVRLVSWSLDSTKVASGSDDSSVRIWDAVTGDCLRILKHYSLCPGAALWPLDNNTIVHAVDPEFPSVAPHGCEEFYVRGRSRAVAIWLGRKVGFELMQH